MGTYAIVPRAPTGTRGVVATTADGRRRLVAACPAEQTAVTLLKRLQRLERLQRLQGKPEPVAPSKTPPSVNPVTAGGSGFPWLEFGQRAIVTDILAVRCGNLRIANRGVGAFPVPPPLQPSLPRKLVARGIRVASWPATVAPMGIVQACLAVVVPGAERKT
jgi:hypothetical protein